MNDNAVAKIQSEEYNHTHDNNIRAIHMEVTASSGAKELKKLENLGLLQVYSKEKQVLIYIDKILAKMKKLKWLHTDRKFEHQKVDGVFKNFQNMKRGGEVPTSVDLVCQKYQFESKEDKDIKYYVFHIIETTDKELEPFIGKCPVQKVDEKDQTFTKPEKVFKFMLDNFPLAYEH